MKKLEFIKELRSRLKGYPKDVVDNAVNYYSECIDAHSASSSRTRSSQTIG